MTAHSLPDTRWSLVARASASDAATARLALGELCGAYWFPLYAFARRLGQSDDDARDHVQSFCTQLLERGGIAGADRDRGHFRHYLLGAFRHFLDNATRAARAEKRGGAVTTWSFADAPARYDRERGDHETPDRVFERRWALALLARATARLRDDYATPTKRALLAALEPVLLGDDASVRAGDVAKRLGATEGAVRVALHRLRQRMRELIRDEVLQTLVDANDLDSELAALREAVANPARKPAANP